jgi:hypothetical protein
LIPVDRKNTGGFIMAPKLATQTRPQLACQICLTEIPASVANSLEGKDYVHYFCGAECYAEWEEKEQGGQKQPVR